MSEKEHCDEPTVVEQAYRLSVLIVTYNSAEVLPGLLDSLPAGLEGTDEFEVVIADNNSSDSSVDLALAHSIQPKVICMGRNAGYSAGINVAARQRRLDADILVLNPDARLLPGSARLLLETLRSPSVGVAIPKMLNEDGTIKWFLRREPSLFTVWADALLGGKSAARLGIGEIVCNSPLYENGGTVDWATGAVLAIARRALRKVGEWDESFFLYSEEVDYMRRVREKGLLVSYIPHAQVVHIGGEYLENPRLSALMAANRIRYYRRHHGPTATLGFRLAVVVGAAMRFTRGRSDRAVFWAALAPWKPPPETFKPPGWRPTAMND
jgi:GT2 family glycosyltransferase